TDVWSVGAILYEMLAGRCPFQAIGLPELFAKILTEPPPRLEQFAEGLPPELYPAVHRALERDRAQRFPTMASFLEAILACPAFAQPPEPSLAWRHKDSIPYERRHERYPIGWRVTLKCADWHFAQRLVASNISRGGVFLVTTQPPPVGSQVELSLELPN